MKHHIKHIDSILIEHFGSVKMWEKMHLRIKEMR